MKKNTQIEVKGKEITVLSMKKQDFISLTDIAKHKSDDPSAVIGNWMRNRNTIEFLGIWESLYNPDFKPLEFEGFRNEGHPQPKRLKKLNQIAIHQMKILVSDGNFDKLKAHE
ncbi:MAG: KilA-N domain-containing protein [Prolixibacteraceae bacterium]|nr:KilA-N domain-containing protein [Prolixibacteraceae bacterium]